MRTRDLFPKWDAVVDKQAAQTEKTEMKTVTVAVDSEAPGNEEKNVSDTVLATDKLADAEHALPLRQFVIAYAVMVVMSFAQDLSSGIFSTLTPYVTSAFERHSLTATTSVLSYIASAIIKLPYAKLIQVWGRTQGFAVMVAFMLLGIIMMATCQNVETYCAAQVFYTIGASGIRFSITIFIADTTAMRNRILLIGITSIPTIGTIWAYGPVTEQILKTVGFRWGFGLWAPILALIFAPLLWYLWVTQKKLEAIKPTPSTQPLRTWWQSYVHYIKEFDVVGILIIATGLTLLLLSVNIYSYQPEGWRAPIVICFLIFGVLLLPIFGLYERYIAEYTFIPWSLLVNRTVITTNIMVLTLQAGEQLGAAYFYSQLIVVFRQSVTTATYITNIYYMGATVTMIIVGVAVRYYGHIKYYALFLGVPLVTLGYGLLIKFRTTNTQIGLVILCQIFIAIGGGILNPVEQLMLMAVSDHDHMPAVLAVEGLFAEVGKAIGFAIAGALWTGLFENALENHLPESEKENIGQIYGDLDVQSSYPKGSAAYEGISLAYGDAQRIILITSCCLFVLTLGCVVFWKDVNVKGMRRLRDRA
ncbi:unnamed protein product [Clonostachys byssicola]|uniref:Major facilitator superfamily (MFS) profile domain-containing protein n=1 Tax=Clonostachys byssicola TaxID=160290 RepID=A0A9N9UCK7_9HYPO|nr:unnamed protein product [Clonostachys byssicola]